MTQDSTNGIGDTATPSVRARVRAKVRELALESAMRKRNAGVPTLTIAEAAAVFSISHEHLYRQVRAGAFPAVRINSRYVVPMKAVDDLLATASARPGCVDVAEWAATWSPQGGAA